MSSNATSSRPTGAQRSRKPWRYALKGFINHRSNPIIRTFAGRRYVPLFALMHHRGRRTGRAYTIPVGALRTQDGFVIPLTFGEEADWYQNVRAAGGCTIQWKGVEYPLAQPEVVDWATARSAFFPLTRVLIKFAGVDQFVRFRRA